MTDEHKTPEVVIRGAMLDGDGLMPSDLSDLITERLRTAGLLAQAPDEDAVKRAAEACYTTMWPNADSSLETEAATQRLRDGVRAALLAARVAPQGTQGAPLCHICGGSGDQGADHREDLTCDRCGGAGTLPAAPGTTAPQPVIDEAELAEVVQVSRRSQVIEGQIETLVRQASEPGSRVRAVVSRPSGLGRNASLAKSLMQYAPGRGVTVPAEGLRDEHSILSWLSAHASELSSADVIVVDGMLTRGPGEGSVSETLVRLLSGHAVQVQRKYAASFELRLKEGFSLVLSETERNARWASSVIAALTPEGSPTKELWL